MSSELYGDQDPRALEGDDDLSVADMLDPGCPKCGFVDIQTIREEPIGFEHYQCQGCGYSWTQDDPL